MIAQHYRLFAIAGATILCIASTSAIGTALAQQSINLASDRSFVDVVPSQDAVTDDDSVADQSIRVAQFFPFFSFGQPVTKPRSMHPLEDESGLKRKRSYEQTTRTPKLARRYSGEAHKDRIVRLLRNPPDIPPVTGPLLLTISVSKQTITVYDAGVPIAKAPVSTGTVERPTPMGVFSVVERSWWHRSNMYSAAPMPFMQRITWSGVALHAGELPGYRASHGCVRLPESFALRLWYTTRIGARVVVAADELAPIEITHPLLFQPSAIPLPPLRPAPSPQLDEVVVASLPDPETPPSQDDPIDNADSAMVVASAPQPASPPDSAVVDDDPELDHMMTAAIDDGDGLYDDPAGQNGLPIALANLQATDIQRPEAPVDIFALARRTIIRRNDAAAAPEPGVDSVLRPGPISVLISRKDRRIYVRKGLQPLFAMPVTITEFDRAWGTHVFTAMSASEDGAKLRWMVVSPSAGPRGGLSPHRSIFASTAAASAALDRIDIPQAVTDRINALVSVGATLIVSDAGLGRTATVLDSDFTVLLK